MGLFRKCKLEGPTRRELYRLVVNDAFSSVYWHHEFRLKEVPDIITCLEDQGRWVKGSELVPKWSVPQLITLLVPLCGEAALVGASELFDKLEIARDEAASARNREAMSSSKHKEEVRFLRGALSEARSEISECHKYLTYISKNVTQALQSECNPSERQKLIADFKEHSSVLYAYRDAQNIVVVLYSGRKVTSDDYLNEISEKGYVMIPNPDNRYIGTKVKITFV